MTQEYPNLTGFQRDLLHVLNHMDEPHGLGIKDALESYLHQEVHHGRLYPNLDTLVDKGLVEKGERDRRTNWYDLTRQGQKELLNRKKWEQDPIPAELE